MGGNFSLRRKMPSPSVVSTKISFAWPTISSANSRTAGERRRRDPILSRRRDPSPEGAFRRHAELRRSPDDALSGAFGRCLLLSAALAAGRGPDRAVPRAAVSLGDDAPSSAPPVVDSGHAGRGAGRHGVGADAAMRAARATAPRDPPPRSRVDELVGRCPGASRGRHRLFDWRKGLFAMLVVAFLQDPVRKLEPDKPVYFTLLVGVVFAVAYLRAQVNSRFLPTQIPGWKHFLRTPSIAVCVAARGAGGEFRRALRQSDHRRHRRALVSRAAAGDARRIPLRAEARARRRRALADVVSDRRACHAARHRAGVRGRRLAGAGRRRRGFRCTRKTRS